jgi:hypothetical protein
MLTSQVLFVSTHHRSGPDTNDSSLFTVSKVAHQLTTHALQLLAGRSSLAASHNQRALHEPCSRNHMKVAY